MKVGDGTSTQTMRIRRHIPGDRTVFLVSDLHLGDGTRSDSFQGKDEELIAFIEHVRQHDAHLVIAGDAIDFDQAWFMSRVLKAHAKLFGELSALADTNGVTYIWGNHDADISLFKDLLRFDVCSSLQIGEDVIVRHGYEYDPFIGPDLEQAGMTTRIHHLVERMLRTWIRTPLQHFYNLPNRLVYWAFHKLTMVLYGLKRLGFTRLYERMHVHEKYWTHSQLGDPQGIFEGVRDALADGPHRYLVTGHSHLPGLVEVHPGRWYANTGSWTFRSAQYAKWDGERITVHDWRKKRTYGDRLYQPLMDKRWRHIDMRGWWRENYLGWLRFRVGEHGPVPFIDPPETDATEDPSCK
jgi:UDP-2,3-diacylglucosamine pyrophosphatase LpxH